MCYHIVLAVVQFVALVSARTTPTSLWPMDNQNHNTNNMWHANHAFDSLLQPMTTPTYPYDVGVPQVQQPQQTAPQTSFQQPQSAANHYLSFEQLVKMAFTNGAKDSKNAVQPASKTKPAGLPGKADNAYIQPILKTTTPKITTSKPTTTTTTTTTTAVTTTTNNPMKTLAKIIMQKAIEVQQEFLINQAMKQSKPSTIKPTTTTTTTATTTTSKPKGCIFKEKWYPPLSEIDRGQSGDWCYGTYCNHDSNIIHWDDHTCTTTSSPPPPTTQAPSSDGCWYHGKWHAPGADIDNGRNYDKCYGTFCDYTSNIVHWEDPCHATVPPVGVPGASSTGFSGGFSPDAASYSPNAASFSPDAASFSTNAAFPGSAGSAGSPASQLAKLDLF